MERKRAESDVFNIQEFCHRLPLDGSENSCARTEAVLISRKDSKSHLKGKDFSPLFSAKMITNRLFLLLSLQMC